jgi:hypothetical protein
MYNKHIKDYTQELENIWEAINFEINSFAVSYDFFNYFSHLLPKQILVSIPIDYPCGLSSSDSKYHMVLKALKAGAKAIDYIPNHYHLKTNIPALKEEISACISMCKTYNASLRLFLDYRNTDTILDMVKLYNSIGVDTFFPTPAYHHDDFIDNVIVSKSIEKQTGCNIIFNGYLWKKSQLQQIIHAKLYGIRLYNTRIWCNKQVG